MPVIKCILLIEDDEITNFISSDILTEMDITENIEIREDGKEAMDYLEKAYSGEAGYCRPDIIFLDLNMPVMDGFTFLKKYKETFEGEDVCRLIIVLSTSNYHEDVGRAIGLKETVTDYMEKPLTKEKMTLITRQYFDVNYDLQEKVGEIN